MGDSKAADLTSRLASVGQLAAGIAHEINTPIQYIGDNLNFIRSAMTKLIALAMDAGRDEDLAYITNYLLSA